ncbi:MAG: DNA adenine methylase [Pelagibacterales bacterium]|nr:DNA adenine methylase [Pelagibacterales bacterium]
MPDPRWFECPVIIPYMGGKFELGKKLIPMIPPHTRYIEVFLGGGSMFFRKGKAEINILNDKHNDLINLYMTVIHKYDDFKTECESLLKSRYLYDCFKQDLKNNLNIDNIPNAKRASKYFYVIKNAFNNSHHTPISKKADWNIEMWDCLETTRRKLDNTMIENLDYRELFKRHPTREDDFWYFDPPYVIAGERGDYYIHNLNNKDHIELFDMVKQIDTEGGKFMVSYDDRTFIKELYKEYIITKIPIKYSGQVHNRNIKNELVITNYIPHNQQMEIL